MCVVCVARVRARSCHTNVAYPPFRSPPLRFESKRVVLADVPLYQKPERGYIWMFPRHQHRNERIFAKTALFTKPPFCFLSKEVPEYSSPVIFRVLFCDFCLWIWRRQCTWFFHLFLLAFMLNVFMCACGPVTCFFLCS